MNAHDETLLRELFARRIGELRREVPAIGEFLESHGLGPELEHLPLGACINNLSEAHYEDIGIDRQQFLTNLVSFWQQLRTLERGRMSISAVTIIGGHDKQGKAEGLTLHLVPGEVTSIVGPTGSGKSRLLADIEWMAQGDTPTGRHILINNQVPDPELRFSLEHKLVAQLSQTMNFVMDASVADFIAMHAEARGVTAQSVTGDILDQANCLAGEAFGPDTPVTALSGGQSRALMIADTAFLSASPVVLIDEVENAGIDRKRALQLLVSQEKVVLIATHDPILALMAQRRVVIAGGGMRRIIETTPAEKANLGELEAMDNRIMSLRQRLRSGEVIESI